LFILLFISAHLTMTTSRGYPFLHYYHICWLLLLAVGAPNGLRTCIRSS